MHKSNLFKQESLKPSNGKVIGDSKVYIIEKEKM